MYDDYLTDRMAELSVNDDRWKELGLDYKIRSQLIKIENDYESIFSWDIQRLTGVNRNLMFNLIDKVREQKNIFADINAKDDEFNLIRYCLQLVASYELYNSKNYKESYLEIESVVQFMEKCKFDESNEQYSDAFHHIARGTYAYIALTLKIDSEKLLKDVKHMNNFNQAEKSAVCAVKARIFMEYPSKGNDIALKFADQARTLHSIEPEWIFVWLKARGRVRRSNEPYKMPGDDEISAADILCSIKSSSKHLTRSAQLYKEVAFINKLNNNHIESTKFFNLSSGIVKLSIELANDDIIQLNSLLLSCMKFTNEFFSESFIEDLVTKLSKVKNGCVDQVLGLYYLKHKKDYVKAKMHLSRAVASGQFGSSLQLIKVECLLQPVNKFPFVKTLNMMYEVFQNPNRRLIILSQILYYYYYCENNPKEMMRYLKLYLDEDIENTFKKRNLIFSRPLFDTGKFLRPNEFLNVLSANVIEIMNNDDWGEEEKNTFDRFNEMLKLDIPDIRFNDNNKTTVYKKNESWRKQRVDFSENKSYENHQQKNESWRKQKNPKPDKT